MKVFIVSVVILLLYLMGSPVLARHHNNHRGGGPALARHHHHASHEHGNIITVDTAAGPIRVAADYATKFKNLIADFVAAGYNPGHVGCFATGGHVRNSRHYIGQACDFDQGDRPHAPFMRSHEAARIISKYGFTNGCSFNDCGHVGTDSTGHRHHYAHHFRHHRRYATT